jgi:hypothetical protein
VIEQTLERVPPAAVHSFDSLYQADGDARAVAADLLKDWPDAGPRHQTAGRMPRGGTPFA